MLLAAFGACASADWLRMRAELAVRPGERIAEWCHPTLPIRFAFSCQTGVSDEDAFAEISGSAIVCEGIVGDAESVKAVLDAYLEHGTRCLRRCREYAIIIWDERRRGLIAACDPTGVSALYHAEDGETLLVSTRALALVKHSRVGAELDRHYLAHALYGLWAQRPEVTAFAHVRRLVPGFALSRTGATTRLQSVDGLALEQTLDRRRSADSYNEEFWAILRTSVTDRLPVRGDASLSLSGGLDSLTIGAALFEERPFTTAHTLVAGATGSNERARIASLLAQHPRVVWREIECRPTSERTPDDSPISDEPLAVAPVIGEDRMNVFREMRDAGAVSAFAGDGGDEVFDLGTQVRAFFDRRDWRGGARFAMQRQFRGLGIVAWRQFIVSHLPRVLKRGWYAYDERRSSLVPSWVRKSFRDDLYAKHVVEEFLDSINYGAFPARLRAALGNVTFLGGVAAYRLFAGAFGLSFRTPLLDRRMIEFFARLPPALQVHPRQAKFFLRFANRARMPRELLTEPKDDSLYDLLSRRAMASDRYSIEVLLRDPFLCEAIDVGSLLAVLARVRCGEVLAANEREPIAFLQEFAAWHAAVRKATADLS